MDLPGFAVIWQTRVSPKYRTCNYTLFISNSIFNLNQYLLSISLFGWEIHANLFFRRFFWFLACWLFGFMMGDFSDYWHVFGGFWAFGIWRFCPPPLWPVGCFMGFLKWFRGFLRYLRSFEGDWKILPPPPIALFSGWVGRGRIDTWPHPVFYIYMWNQAQIFKCKTIKNCYTRSKKIKRSFQIDWPMTSPRFYIYM